MCFVHAGVLVIRGCRVEQALQALPPPMRVLCCMAQPQLSVALCDDLLAMSCSLHLRM